MTITMGRHWPTGRVELCSHQAQSSCDKPSGPAAMLMELTPEQRARIQRLLEDELRKAYRSAIEQGASPADVHDLVTSRRQALADLFLDLADDPEHPLDDPDDGDGVGEQRG